MISPPVPRVSEAPPESTTRAGLRPLLWVPSLYLAMGIPFNVVMGGTAARMYKSLGYSDSRITVGIGAIGVAWSLKPLWAAFLEMHRTKKFFVLSMEFAITVILACVAAAVPAPGFFRISIGLFWAAAFASSTQDICADGIYLTSLDTRTQARLAGVQGTFWILGKVLAAGVLISVLDRVRVAYQWSDRFMWQAVLLVCAAAMAALGLYHAFRLPSGGVSERPESARAVVRDFLGTASSFFHKRAFWGMMAFVFLYRLGEGLILIEGQLFLQSPVGRGGLGLSPGYVSDIYAVWGTGFCIVGGILGGMFVSKIGLARCLGFLGLCLNVPHFTYVVLSQIAGYGHGASYATIASLVSVEQFGYGFGFVGNMIYMMQQIAPGRSTMTHYAFATALMNLVLVPTNMISGPLAESLGFSTYFLVVMFASVPSAWAAFRAPFPRAADGPAGGAPEVTADDPSRLSPAERRVQRIAGRASIYAMLNALTILLVDAQILGSLQGRPAGSGGLQFGLLCGSAALKVFLSVSSFRAAAEAGRAATEAGGSVYLANARGARWATVVCGILSVLILGFGALRAF
jgi:PAT family beta-lactamase induction signal transducer AmpG